jgi:hypothetical protein
MADELLAPATRKTSRAHKPTRRATESAAQAKKLPPPPTSSPPQATAQKRPEDMTIEEIVEHIDAPLREYLEDRLLIYRGLNDQVSCHFPYHPLNIH